MVTGATGAIGRAIAAGLAATPGLEVVLVARNHEKGDRLQKDLRKTTGNPRVQLELADLSRNDSIADLAARWQGPLHFLINNAAITPRRREENPEGIELQWATNVLGYFRMMQSFESALSNARGARVINVASYWAGGLDLNDPEFKSRRYDNDEAYRASKQADRMLTVAFAERWNSRGITVNACHPGDVNSTLSNNLGFGGHQTPAEGARTPLWLALDRAVGQKSGRYFEHCSESPCPFGRDKQSLSRLIDLCQNYN